MVMLMMLSCCHGDDGDVHEVLVAAYENQGAPTATARDNLLKLDNQAGWDSGWCLALWRLGKRCMLDAESGPQQLTAFTL